MIATDEDSLICDLAETYNIYDYKSLPLSKVAIFSVGLRDTSRIKMKMNGMNHSFETLLLAGIVDRLSNLVWMQTKDGQDGINQPKSIVASLMGETEAEDVLSFNTPEEFENAKQKILEGSGG